MMRSTLLVAAIGGAIWRQAVAAQGPAPTALEIDISRISSDLFLGRLPRLSANASGPDGVASCRGNECPSDSPFFSQLPR
jgi:hypothetical protein